MTITRKFLEDRLAGLRKQQDQLLANLNAFNGAVQDCQELLAVLDAPEPTAAAAPPEN